MLSQHKTYIRFVESLAEMAIPGALGVAAFAHLRPNSPFPLELAEIGLFAVLMLSFGTACALSGEFAKAIQRATASRALNDGLSSAEVGQLVRWAPVWQKAAAIGGVVLAVGTGLTLGGISWTSDMPFTSTDALGASLYLSAFYLFSLPVLGSASRMSGSYADHWFAGQPRF